MWKVIIVMYSTVILTLVQPINIVHSSCSWILWTKIEKVKDTSDNPHIWRVHKAFSDVQECGQEIKSAIQRQKDSIEKSFHILGHSKVEVGFDNTSGFLINTLPIEKGGVLADGSFSVEHLCLPDHVDPRK